MADTKKTEKSQDSTRQDSTRQDTIPGDILTQLDAESATLGKVYSSVQAIKHATDVGNNIQQDTQDLLLDIGIHVEAISSVLSSLDSKMERLVNKFLSGGLGNPGAQGNFNNQNNQNQSPPNPNTGPTPRYNDAVEQAITDALREYNNQSSGRDRDFYQEQAQKMMSEISDKVTKLSNDFRAGNITQAEFEAKMNNLGQQAGQLHDAIQDTAEHNNAVIQNVRSAFASAVNGSAQGVLESYMSQRTEGLEGQMNDLISQFEKGQISEQDFNSAVQPLIGEMSSLTKGVQAISSITSVLKNGFDANTGQNHTAKQATSVLGDIAGEVVGKKVGAAIGTAVGGPVGAIIGEVVGGIVADKVGAVFEAIGDELDYLANQGKKSRDEILRAGFDKIEKDVKAMATYSIEIYEAASSNIYSAWDKNLASINATQGYTKQALNTLQDAVAQRLVSEGYGNTIDASQYLDQLSSTLNAHLGGELAEAFAAQNLILQKAVPEVDLSSMAAQFAAIYTNANAEGGNGEEEMIEAMNQVAGAAKALEQVTGGNNQFLTQTGSILTKATELVNRADGNASQIGNLATQMMAAEAPLTALAPQLSGFTNELVDILTNNNDATAVSLRAIMNDIDSSIGVSSTAFMESFMKDTQGTLSTAFQAIQQFIDNNQNEASRQEFLQAMESVFGISGSKLAQVNFGDVAKQIAQANTATNMSALTKAENLVKEGETTTLEEQLVANTANQLLATNAISSTIDNKLMRKLESNELQLEKTVYELQATQSVNLAEESMGFFTKIFDIITSIIDPLGLFDMVNTSIDSWASAAIDAERYLTVSTMSQIGSDVASAAAGAANTISNTIGGANAAIAAAETKNTTAMAAAVAAAGTADPFEIMMMKQANASAQATASAAQASAATEAQTLGMIQNQNKQDSEYQQKAAAADEQQAEYEQQKAQAAQAQREQEEADRARDLENHDNISEIKDAIAEINLDDYLSPILEENKDQNVNLKAINAQIIELIQLVSTMVEYKLATDSTFAATISYDEKARIMNNGYVGGLNNGYQAAFV